MASTPLVRWIQRARAPGGVSARRLVGLLLAFGVGACGFHLRGEANYAFTTVYLNSPATAAITTDLKRSLDQATDVLFNHEVSSQILTHSKVHTSLLNHRGNNSQGRDSKG